MLLEKDDRLPPLRPLTSKKASVSCHKPGRWLIRAWNPYYASSFGGQHMEMKRLVSWIMHHVGTINAESDLEWFGYIYTGLPAYMATPNRSEAYQSGLTIQYFIETNGVYTLKYGDIMDLEIPENGCVQRRHEL